jgi:hypothetical protein
MHPQPSVGLDPGPFEPSSGGGDLEMIAGIAPIRAVRREPEPEPQPPQPPGPAPPVPPQPDPQPQPIPPPVPDPSPPPPTAGR